MTDSVKNIITKNELCFGYFKSFLIYTKEKRLLILRNDIFSNNRDNIHM